jgi:hypothetical protein
MLWTKSSTAAGVGTTGVAVQITHPFHPHCGQTFELINRGQHWGEDRVIYRALDGTLPTIAAEFTDLGLQDAFRHVAAGRAAFRTVDLLGLQALLDQVAERLGGDLV